jgi:sugar phosphate isomerase/epimerase
MYRRAVISDEISQDLAAAAQLAADYHLDAVELRNLWGVRADQLDEASIGKVKEVLAPHGLAVAAIAAPFLKAHVDDGAEYERHLEIFRQSCRVAHAFGTSLVRAFTFWKDRPLAEIYSRLLDLYVEPIRIAEAEGVTIAVENEASTFIATGEQLARFLADLGSPSVKALWDPGNARFDELRERAYPDGYRAVRDQIAHVHLKDCAANPATGRYEWVRLGTGEIDVAGQLRALVGDGYAGYVSLETHYRPTGPAESAPRSPSGRVYSEPGARGTAECLASWEALRDSSAR